MRGSRWPLLLLVLFCSGLVAGSFAINKPLPRISLDVGAERQTTAEGQVVTADGHALRNFFAFHTPEQWGTRTFRWANRRGTVTFPSALRMQPLMLEIVACGCRPDGRAVPAQLSLNNTPLATLEATTAWRTYRLLVPSTLTHPEYDVMAEVQGPVWVDDSGRSLGLAVDRITLRQPVAPALAAPWSLLFVLAGIVGVFWWSGGRDLLRPVLLGLVWLVFNLAYQPQLLPQSLLAGILVVGVLVLWWTQDASDSSDDSLTVVARTVAARNGISLLWAGVGLWLVLSPQLLGYWIVDDAYISFRYGQHLVSGHGLVFNVGERVEGYTNFLWTLLIAGAMAAGHEPVIATIAGTMLLGFGVVGLTLALAHRMIPEPWAWLAPLLLVLNTPFLLYTVRGSGMETALFAALTLATLLALTGRRWAVAGLLVALTMMTRPDGVVLAGVGALYVHWMSGEGGQGRGNREQGTGEREQRRMDRGESSRITNLVQYVGVAAALYIPYFLWRWSYYGYLLPNTFYAKVGTTWTQVWRGWEYLWQAGRGDLVLPIALVSGIVGGAAWHARGGYARWPQMSLVGGFALLFCLYVVSVGGDFMPGVRFLVPVVAVLLIVVAWGIAGLAGRIPTACPLLLAGVVLWGGLLATLLPHTSSTRTGSPVQEHIAVVRHHRETGRWVQTHTSPDTLLATPAAGVMPYYAERPIIDILGLTNTHIAHLSSETLGSGRAGHEKSDPDYVMQQQPDLIVYKGASLLWDHPDFQHYRLMTFDGPEGRAVKLYVREGYELYPNLASQPEEGRWRDFLLFRIFLLVPLEQHTRFE